MKQVEVYADVDDVLNQIEASDVVDHFDVDDLLDHMTTEQIISYVFSNGHITAKAAAEELDHDDLLFEIDDSKIEEYAKKSKLPSMKPPDSV